MPVTALAHWEATGKQALASLRTMFPKEREVVAVGKRVSLSLPVPIASLTPLHVGQRLQRARSIHPRFCWRHRTTWFLCC
jgi:hypothetical protein